MLSTYAVVASFVELSLLACVVALAPSGAVNPLDGQPIAATPVLPVVTVTAISAVSFGITENVPALEPEFSSSVNVAPLLADVVSKSYKAPDGVDQAPV